MPPERAWDWLVDVERIAPCLPGAQLLGVEGDEYQGSVKVRVGPVTTEYRGTASFQERDPDLHRVVLRASGRETKGQGGARATVTAQLHPQAQGTAVEIATELDIQGRVAQFGRGMIEDVSRRLLKEFASRLEQAMAEAGPAEPTPSEAPEQAEPAPAPGPPPTVEVEAIDLWALSRASLGRRLLLPLGLGLLALLLIWRWRRGAGGG